MTATTDLTICAAYAAWAMVAALNRNWLRLQLWHSTWTSLIGGEDYEH